MEPNASSQQLQEMYRHITQYRGDWIFAPPSVNAPTRTPSKGNFNSNAWKSPLAPKSPIKYSSTKIRPNTPMLSSKYSAITSSASKAKRCQSPSITRRATTTPGVSRTPTSKERDMSLINSISRLFSEEARDLIDKLLQPNASCRCNALQIREHSWFSETESSDRSHSLELLR